MPYIKQEQRAELRHRNPESEGELNYEITRICHEYIGRHGLNYSVLNAVVGVLECAKLEVYRTIASPYEDDKRSSNGSISYLDKVHVEEKRK